MNDEDNRSRSEESRSVREMSLWGAGPKFMPASIALLSGAIILARCYPRYFSIEGDVGKLFQTAGIILLGLGIPFWILSSITIFRGWREDRLLTGGIYALVRHPLYTSFILFIFPGTGMLFRSWPALFVPFVLYGLFRISIRKEEEYLESKFGEDYRSYRARVNAIFPFHNFRRNH